MKIGILTFHRATNYGAVLQAYALQEYLKSCGHKVEIIDYSPPGMGKIFIPIKDVSTYRKLRRIVANIYYFPRIILKIRRRKDFRNFINKWLNLSNTSNLKDKIGNDFDVYIIGSDQVWNTVLTAGFDHIYWGNFKTAKNVKKIAYAVSASENIEQTFKNQECFDALSNFDAISVREEELRIRIKDKVKIPVVKVVDPTILAGKEILNKLTSINFNENKYLLIYQVNTNADKFIQRLAKDYAQRNSVNIIELPSGITISKMLFDNHFRQWTTPEHFVTYFKNAEFILTTSFHGVVFSLLYNRPFYVISLGKSIDSRSRELLSSVGLEKRIILQSQKDINYEDINWEDVNKKLHSLQNKSRIFLNEILSK